MPCPPRPSSRPGRCHAACLWLAAAGSWAACRARWPSCANKAKEYATMQDSTTNVNVLPLPQSRDVLTAILRDGAQRMLTQAIEAEVRDWIQAHAEQRDERGRRQVVRNGHLPRRKL